MADVAKNREARKQRVAEQANEALQLLKAAQKPTDVVVPMKSSRQSNLGPPASNNLVTSKKLKMRSRTQQTVRSGNDTEGPEESDIEQSFSEPVVLKEKAAAPKKSIGSKRSTT